MRYTNDEILAKVSAFCAEQKLLVPPCAHVAAAVSGGADSMALLRILLALQPERGYTLSVCHVNHGLRGANADADEAFVSAECARLGVPLRVFHAQELGAVPPHAGEDWARRLRYTCFAQILQETAANGKGITCLATAHTATDQTETLLFRLARGTGLHGAAGIRPARGQYIRPLLCLTREETEAYCMACGQKWITDETNDTDAYARNRLRRSALPALRSANAAAERNSAAFCEKAARASAYFEREGQRLLEKARISAPDAQAALPAAARYALAAGQPVWRLLPLQQAEPLILEAALYGLVAPVRDAEQKYMELLAALVQQGTGAVQLASATRFCAGGGVFWREEQCQKQLQTEPFVQPFCPKQQAEYRLPGEYVLKTRLIKPHFEEKTQRVHKKDLKNEADYAKIVALHPQPVLRSRQPGDRYAPAGHGINRELRKWMNEAGIPPYKRDTLPLLASGSRVLWVCGAGFAEGLAPDAYSAEILQIWEEVES